MKIFVLEDNKIIRDELVDILKKEGYEIYQESNGLKGIEKIKEIKPDLIILDVGLPGIDGFRVCSIIRKKKSEYGNPLILFLTSKRETEDVIFGLEEGADDYIKKPFDNEELLCRIKVLSRRAISHYGNEYKYKDLYIDSERNLVLENGEELVISKKEYDLLLYIIINKGIVLSREKIFEAVWKTEYYEGNRTLDMFLSRLRKKVKTIDDNLLSVRGFGYKLNS